MSQNAVVQLGIFLFILILLLKPLGNYMARVYEMKNCGLNKVVGPIERLCYRLAGINPLSEMTAKEYFKALLYFNLMGFLFLLGLLMLQGKLPYNPEHFHGFHFELALNTAMSFTTNTNWQAYAGESSISDATDVLGLTVHNFVSAATGMAVLVALIRGFTRREMLTIGNFWVDMIRGTLYILLPLSIIFALFYMSQGVIENLHAYVHAGTQILPMGLVASHEAIKELGTNGGGIFNANSAHPFENPTPFSNFLEILAMLLIPAALCQTFGCMVRDMRQGHAILFAMTLLFVSAFFLQTYFEQTGRSEVIAGQAMMPNLEGKELRFGVTDSTLFVTAATATSTGATNTGLDSMTPMGGGIALFLMQTGEVVFGGVGSGLYSMLVLVIITVFIAGLMVGRTPEYLGKKIEPFEMKMASIVILLMPALVLLSTAGGVLNKEVIAALGNPGAHGFSEILYAFTSMGNNNGSAFAGINANIPFMNILGTLVIFLGRFAVICPILAIAGALAKKKMVPVGPGTLPTHSGFFIGLLIAVVLIVAGLTFIPALALGPIAEQMQMMGAAS